MWMAAFLIRTAKHETSLVKVETKVLVKWQAKWNKAIRLCRCSCSCTQHIRNAPNKNVF